MLRISDLEYDLPAELVATAPASPRDSARLMVLSRRAGGGEPEGVDRRVRDLAEFLRPGDLLVVNSTCVVPARFMGVRADSGGHAEGLFVAESERPAGSDATPGLTWNVLIKARRAKPGVRFLLTDHAGHASDISLRLLARASTPGDGAPPAAADGLTHDHGGWLAAVERKGSDTGGTPVPPGHTGGTPVPPGHTGGTPVPLGHTGGTPVPPLDTIAILNELGLTPLPPYIRQARKRAGEEEGAAAGRDRADRAAYQTVYADASRSRSVAAPTAGLHFTPELLAALADRGVERAEVVLHVGLGTFAPVEAEFVEQHPMHAEWCHVPAKTAAAIGRCRERGGRVIAVGTTSARTLESFTPEELGAGEDVSRWTRVLIAPGHRWRNVDGLMTNFHLPRTTLLALVASLLEGGAAELLGHYRRAVEQRYRFFSFGDAMLVVP